MKISAFANRYDLTRGEGPAMLVDPSVADLWYGRDPFRRVVVEGISDNLLIPEEGTLDGHTLMRDSTFTDSIRVDPYVPIAPLFVKDLCGRIVYIGMGPDRKGQAEWQGYLDKDTTLPEDERNPWLPLVVFPRYARDTKGMEGADLLEEVFLTKFRCLEMGMTFSGTMSGADEDDPLVAASYLGANLYPYKLRLDTFYVDGYKVPQVLMVYARGLADGINPGNVDRVASEFMAQWAAKAADEGYEAWLESLGDDYIETLYQAGLTVIPTFEACNGFQVVSRDFKLEDYWPGRAVPGLHDIVETVADASPAGTILDVISPGYVTYDRVLMARVVVSDGSGYVSPNAEDPLPFVPNLNLPHSRVIDDWRSTWVPSHPLHFEAPAVWGWDVQTGRFMQLSGPLWDPLHYYYESVDYVLKAFDTTPLPDRKGLVPVPELMFQRFFPVVPMVGFDTFSLTEFRRRYAENVLPETCIKRIFTDGYSVGIGYHPMPAEYEFEIEPFWFPEMHPLNRDINDLDEELMPRLAPVVSPRITKTLFRDALDVPEDALWFSSDNAIFTPEYDPYKDFPHLVRYTVPEIDPEQLMRLCPTPYLSSMGEKLKHSAQDWWKDEDGQQLDDALAFDEFAPGVYGALWDVREMGVQLVKFRHLVYQTNLPLYNMAWWYGWSIENLEDAMAEWINPDDSDAELERVTGELLEGAPPEVI